MKAGLPYYFYLVQNGLIYTACNSCFKALKYECKFCDTANNIGRMDDDNSGDYVLNSCVGEVSAAARRAYNWWSTHTHVYNSNVAMNKLEDASYRQN
jgi:hypothetical protein